MRVGFRTRHTSTKARKAHAAAILVLLLCAPALAAGPRRDDGEARPVLAQLGEPPATPPPGAGLGPSLAPGALDLRPAATRPEARTGEPTEVHVQVGAPVTPQRGRGAEPVLESDLRRRRRRPWVATLCIGGVTLLTGAVLGGLALDRARAFDAGLHGGASMDQLLALRAPARQYAFATDVLLGTTALMGAITLVLRFGTAPSERPEPMDLERAYQVPSGGPSR